MTVNSELALGMGLETSWNRELLIAFGGSIVEYLCNICMYIYVNAENEGNTYGLGFGFLQQKEEKRK